MIHLIINYFRCSLEERQQEYDRCLCDNIKNEHIDHIHILTNVDVPFESPKITVKRGYDRAKFDDFTNYMRKNKLKGIVIIANLDILFDDTIRLIRKHVDKKRCVALCRHEYNEKEKKWAPWGRRDSQDVWAFKTPILSFNADFYIGQRGCDNVLAGTLKSIYIVTSPVKEIVAKHIHTLYRNHGVLPVVRGKIGYV